MAGKRILLIVGGGIAAYKALEVVRLLRRAGHSVQPVLTASGEKFVTPTSLAALAEAHVRTSLWSLEDEAKMGHIQLSRDADLVVVCPASASLLARMAGGHADDLATTLLLATDKPVLAVPAMNVRMWLHPATRRNVAQLRADGVRVMEPDEGDMACGEYGPGRLPEPARILAEIERLLHSLQERPPHPLMSSEVETRSPGADFSTWPDGQVHPERLPGQAVEGLEATGVGLKGKHILVTAGPTHEPIDPVRVLANRSSGRQGFAIAHALAAQGARVTLVAGPVHLPTPPHVTRIDVETAREMAAAVDAALPADAAVLVAAVADWRVEQAPEKLKKADGPPSLEWEINPDILATLAAAPDRPRLVVGFAAETADVVENARGKLASKGADWIVANHVADGLGTPTNTVHLVSAAGVESWPEMDKAQVAQRLAARIADALT